MWIISQASLGREILWQHCGCASLFDMRSRAKGREVLSSLKVIKRQSLVARLKSTNLPAYILKRRSLLSQGCITLQDKMNELRAVVECTAAIDHEEPHNRKSSLLNSPGFLLIRQTSVVCYWRFTRTDAGWMRRKLLGQKEAMLGQQNTKSKQDAPSYRKPQHRDQLSHTEG